ncbi:hypothetical protein [Solimonas sp. K1W22B-7]|uniref:hypothetical protein n=1 Tax=Solimonas sp. K1W22B-7 TaxID=2303331 RepID=UPI003F8FF5A3
MNRLGWLTWTYQVCVPRARGDEELTEIGWWSDETVFPAHAGMKNFFNTIPRARLCVPRARGDEPKLLGGDVSGAACFPRTRDEPVSFSE